MSDNRAIAYWEGETLVVRASASGRSARCLTAAALAYTPEDAPDYLVKAAARGNRLEPVVRQMLKDRGWKVSGAQPVYDLEVAPNLVLRGHLDVLHAAAPPTIEVPGELWFDPARDYMCEIKSMSEKVFDKWVTYGFEAFPEYACQLSSYMEMVGRRPALYAVIQEETDQLLLQEVLDPPVPFEDIRTKLVAVYNWAKADTLPPCDSQSQYRCEYQFLCDKALGPLFEEVESGTETVLTHLAREHDEVKRLLGDLEARKETIRNEMRRALGARQKVSVPGYTYTMSTRKTSKKLDEAALRARLGDALDEYYKPQKEYEVLTVRSAGGGKKK